jgi:hypothetical protein
MAIYKAIANGNWSNLAIWQDNSSGSFLASTVLPSVNDDVYANNFIVEIDIPTITINRLSNTLITGLTNNLGRFELAINCTITCTSGIEGSFAGTVGTINSPLSATLYIKSTVNVNIYGDMTAGVQGRYAVSCDNPSTITIVGNQYGRINQNSSAALLNTSTATYNITGDQIGGSGTNTNTNVGINNIGSGIFNIIGNQTGGGNSNAAGITSTVGIINITGNQQGSVGPGIFLSVTGSTLTIIGNCYGGANSAIIVNSINSQVTYTGSVYNISGVQAINSPKLYLNQLSTAVYEFQDFSGATNTLYPANALPGTPATTDVRQGTTYGAGGSLTGTLEVPPASSVAVGVPVDNTVGTAIISITDMGALLASYNV